MPSTYKRSRLITKKLQQSLRKGALSACVPVLVLGIAGAQTSGTAAIQGVVMDTTGAVVPNASIMFQNNETGTARQTSSDSAGNYSLPNLPVGSYTIRISAQGFSVFAQQGTLEVGNNVSVEPHLAAGSTNETVMVQAQGASLDTETSSYKQVIDQKRITELPLNGRQATQLVLVSGGAVTAPATDVIGTKTYFSSTVIAVAGSQGNYNNYALDGGTNTDSFTNVNLPFPFPDALREFSVESNSLPARNGLHPGALVNVVTNSGSNQWHGTLFEFIRNNIINATNFFSNTTDTLKRSQFGGTLGGRIKSDKLFVFGGYQNTQNRQVGNSTNYCVPTAAELAGDFSKMGGLCPAKTATLIDPITHTAAVGRQIPTSHFSQPSLNLVNYLSDARAHADQFGLVNVAIPANYSETQYIGRVDYNLSAKQTMFVRYFLAQYNQPAYFSPTNLLLTTTSGNDERVQNATFGDTFIITPKLVNTFHATWARRRDNRGPTAGGINANTIGVNLYTYVPNDLEVAVTNGPTVGSTALGYFNTNTEDFSDDVDYVHGKHQIAVGAEVLRTAMNVYGGARQNGYFTFTGQWSGEGMVDFLTGQLNGFSQSRAQKAAFRQTIFSAYAQDTIHFTHNLTMNVGLRWEPFLMAQDQLGRGGQFSEAAFLAGQKSKKFPMAPAGTLYYGDPGIPKGLTDDRLARLSPRLSLTYSPNTKTVFRLGAAIMYDSPGLFATQRMTTEPPFTPQLNVAGQVNFADPWSGKSPFPGIYPPDATSTFFTNSLFFSLPQHIQNPTVNQWTASLQQDLGKGWTMSLNYLGSSNNHLWLGRAINPSLYIPGTSTGANGSCGPLTTATGLPAAGQACSSVSNTLVRGRLALLNYANGIYYNSGSTALDDGANSNYNGMIVSVQHRMSNSFSLLTNYTWSHCIAPGDTNGDFTNPSYQNPTNTRADRGPCGFDARHIFNTTIVAESNFRSINKIEKLVVNGWQIAPLVRVVSGLPFNIATGTDNSLSGVGQDRPNLNPGVSLYPGTKITRSGSRVYFNAAAFTANPLGTFGTLPRNFLRGPDAINIDASLNRRFPIRERVNLNLRLEAFNILNHPNFTGFSTSLNSASFGQASSAGDPRIFQAAAKITF